MKNSLYKIPFNSFLPKFEGPEQVVIWTKNKFDKDTIFLYLQDFNLEAKHLKAAPWLGGDMRNQPWVRSMLSPMNIKLRDKAIKEFLENNMVKGKLLLSPCLQKVWISNHALEDFELL